MNFDKISSYKPRAFVGQDADLVDTETVVSYYRKLIDEQVCSTDDFEKWLHLPKTDHPVKISADAHYRLVSIHPFVDGNGRMSRLLMNYLLQRNKYPWINIYNKHRGSYLRTVRKAYDQDYLSIIDFCIKTSKENLESFKIV